MFQQRVAVGFCCFLTANGFAKANNDSGAGEVHAVCVDLFFEEKAGQRIMATKRKSGLTTRSVSAEAEALDTLNARLRRKAQAARLVEASIETKAKAKRRQQAATSSAWKH
jgi:hypothetical protein